MLFAGTRFQAPKWHFCLCVHQRHVLLLNGTRPNPGLSRQRFECQSGVDTDDVMNAEITYFLTVEQAI